MQGLAATWIASLAVPPAAPPSFAPGWCKGANPQLAGFPWTGYSGGKISTPYVSPSKISFAFTPRLSLNGRQLNLGESVGWNANLFMVATGDYTCEKTCQYVGGAKQCGPYLEGECNVQCDASYGAQCGNCVEIDLFETFTPGYFVSTSHRTRITDADGQHTAFWYNTAQPGCAGSLPPTLGGVRLPYQNYTWDGSGSIDGELTFEPDETQGMLKIYASVQGSPPLLIYADARPSKAGGEWLPGWSGCHQGSTNATNPGNGYRGWACGLSFMSSVWTGAGGYAGNAWGVPEGVDDASCPWHADPSVNPPPNIERMEAGTSILNAWRFEERQK